MFFKKNTEKSLNFVVFCEETEFSTIIGIYLVKIFPILSNASVYFGILEFIAQCLAREF